MRRYSLSVFTSILLSAGAALLLAFQFGPLGPWKHGTGVSSARADTVETPNQQTEEAGYVEALVRTGLAGDKDSTWGTVKGRVVLDGKAIPGPKKVEVNKDQDHCLSKGPIFSEEFVVNPKNKGIRWTFVWLAPETAEQKLAVHPSLEKIPQKQVSIDQPCCMFVPHALAIREGQDVEAKNSAPVPHNVHWTGHPLKNPGGNQILPAKQSLLINGLKADKYPVQISCDIHGWMRAWVRVFGYPYFAVTDEDGKFEIKLAPAGKCRLVIWHETGYGPGGRDGVPIEIRGGGDTDAGEIRLKAP